MKIEIRLFATLRRYSTEAGGTFITEVEEGLTVGELIRQLNIDSEEVKIIMVNGAHAEHELALKEGDRVGLFPPVGGG